jgi:hypothetical protein
MLNKVRSNPCLSLSLSLHTDIIIIYVYIYIHILHIPQNPYLKIPHFDNHPSISEVWRFALAMVAVKGESYKASVRGTRGMVINP